MSNLRYLAAAALLVLGPASSDGAPQARQRVPPPGASQGGAPEQQAVPREQAPPPPPTTAPAPQPAPQPATRSAPAASARRERVPPARAAEPPPPAAAAAPDPQAVPRRNPPGDEDRPATGRAIPRPADRPADRGRTDDWDGRRYGGRIYSNPPRTTYNNYYYSYPRRYYPYGYGAFGLGYFYYDPYTWYPYGYSYDPYYSTRNYGYRRGYGFDIGSLRLDVNPTHADVFVDGYFAGRVDDFDGRFQSLDLEAGPYRIEIVAPGYEPLEINIRIQPGQKTTYRGDLRRRP